MKRNTFCIIIFGTCLLLFLAACGNSPENKNGEENPGIKTQEKTDAFAHEGHHKSGSGEVPENLKEAENPTYKIGSHAIIEADHMEGMKGAEATITGAYDTTAYTVTYKPTTGGKEVKNHKWVIHEEIENAGDAPLEPGTEVVLLADHMEGMKGATATIDSAEKTTVYMVDFVPTTGGEEVKNHKWVTESELSPVD